MTGDLSAISIAELADQTSHMDDRPGAVTADELESTGEGVMLGASTVFSGGGVTLLGGDKYELLRMLQKEIMSNPSSIAPFNLIPYLTVVNNCHYGNVRSAHLVATSLSLSVVRACPCTAILQVSSARPYSVAR